LRRVLKMLQRATAAAPEVLASGLHARRRRLEHADELGFLHLAAPLAQRDFDAFAGQRVSDEDFSAVEIGDTQADAVMELVRGAGFAKVFVIQDLSGRDRVVAGRQELNG